MKGKKCNDQSNENGKKSDCVISRLKENWKGGKHIPTCGKWLESLQATKVVGWVGSWALLQWADTGLQHVYRTRL